MEVLVGWILQALNLLRQAACQHNQIN